LDEANATYLADTYRFSWPEEGIEILVDRMVESRGDLTAEVTVRIAHPFAALLRQAKFNLSSTRTRTEWTRALLERSPEVDWYAAIEQICTLTLRHWREGAAFLDLSLVEPRQDDAYMLKPYVIEGAASGVFADGGAGKSLFALAVALTIATGEPVVGAYPSRCAPVLYLDWEWDEEAHSERLRALCEGCGIDPPAEMIYYRREFASINESAPAIRRFIAEHEIGFVVVDSLGFARGGEPESAELTIKTFASMRTFGVPVLFVDHVAKNTQDKTHSFGSVYTRNSARLMWRMDTDANAGESQKLIGLVNTKWNRKFERPRGLMLDIETDDLDHMISARFTDTEPPLQSIRTSGLKATLVALLRQNPEGLTVADMRTALEAENVKASENVLGATLARKANKNVFSHDFQTRKWRLTLLVNVNDGLTN